MTTKLVASCLPDTTFNSKSSSAPIKVWIVVDVEGNTELHICCENALKRLGDNPNWKVHSYNLSDSFGRIS